MARKPSATSHGNPTATIVGAAEVQSYDIFAAQFAAHMDAPDNGYCTPSSLWSGAPSPSSSDGAGLADSNDESSSTSQDAGKLAQKTKRANRYKNCTEAVLSRRRAQNRANQRAYRKRKDLRLQELQEQLDSVNQKNNALSCAYSLLAGECSRLKAAQPSESPEWSAATVAMQDNTAPAVYHSDPSTTTALPDLSTLLDCPGSPDEWWTPYP